MNSQNDLTLWLQSQGVCDSLKPILGGLADAGMDIALAVRSSALEGKSGAAGTINVQGEEQKDLDIISNDIVLEHLTDLGQIAAMVSEEITGLIANDNASADAPYAVCFDPLDGSSNIETNSAIGSIFSVLEMNRANAPVSETDILQASKNQVAAGYVLYGPTTMLVLTTGKSVAMFVLDLAKQTFILTDDDLSIPQKADEFSINTAYAQFWDKAVTTYVENCVKGEKGPRAKAFNMRWSAAMVADVHRLFIRGGIFIYPGLNKPGVENGKLRFFYEANPMAMLVEIAGGAANMRQTAIRELVPSNIHQRVPVIMGSKEEVAQLSAHYLGNTF